jgi:hypothetical protein
MAKKTYKSLTGIHYTFPVRVKKDGKEESIWVSFRGNGDCYVTSIAEVQTAIENTDKFKNGEIGLENAPGESASEQWPPAAKPEHKVFPEVTDINMAVELLNAEPYKVDKRSLKTPAGILAKATEYNVEFPNLKLD